LFNKVTFVTGDAVDVALFVRIAKGVFI